MKKIISFVFVVLFVCLTAASVSSCKKDNPSGKKGDALSGTTWSGVVTYSYKDGHGGGAVSGDLTLEFNTGGSCYVGFWQETVSYSFPDGAKALTLKSKNVAGGVMELAVSGNKMTVSGGDNEYTYSGTLSKK